MSKIFEKALLLCPEKYSLFNSFFNVLEQLSSKTIGFDIKASVDKMNLKIHSQIYRFPYNVRIKWETYLMTKVNLRLLNKISDLKPDLVFVYNSEFLLPETCRKIKESSTLIFFMGDSPFYTPVNNYYLTCLTYADLILAPDSFWIDQLNTLGIERTLFFVPCLDTSSYFPVSDVKKLSGTSSSEVFYAGMSYVNSWGYKKALLMNEFTRFDFKLYGNKMWKRWFRFFPELKTKYTESNFIPADILNNLINKTKLVPVDGNPAILNGFHLRLIEALGAGALPIIEFRKDVEEKLFKGCNARVPLIRNYKKAGEIAAYFLKNEQERKEIALELKTFISTKYSPENNSELLRTALLIQ